MGIKRKIFIILRMENCWNYRNSHRWCEKWRDIMKKNEIYGYESLVDDLKELIHKKQYQVIKLINSETINLYWEIGEEIYRQQQEKGWGNQLYKCFQ